MAGRISGLALAYTAAGGVLLWSGVTGTTISTTVRGLLSGQAPAGGQEPITTDAASAAAAAPAAVTTPAAAGTGAAGGTSQANATAAANQATARLLAAPYGWSAGTQWDDLVALWQQESGWNAKAVNPSSGATGIPQLLPSAHAVPAGWASPAVQIAWGLDYISSRYGSPAAAWAHEQSAGWY